MKKLLILCTLGLLMFVGSCKKNTPEPDLCLPVIGDLTDIEYNPTDYNLDIPPGFPMMPIPPDNPLTEEGIELGRHLFYDPILSADSTMSCFSCHNQSDGFSDINALSVGIDGIEGKRHAMALINIGYNIGGMFWDGRSNTIEEQALLPVEDPVELHDTWENVECKLSRHADYPAMFRAAFGITDKSLITRDLVAKALSQFQRALVSSNSRYDDIVYRNLDFFEDDEQNGHDMFFDLATGFLPDAECGHCHNKPMFTINFQNYRNNGLDNPPNINSFPDLGRGEVTGNQFDNGKFKIPTLRNIALTAPYMHDGRFQTLEEVIDHYNAGGHGTYNPGVEPDPLILPLGLTDIQKQEILAFLHTLTDTTFLNNPAFSNPFE